MCNPCHLFMPFYYQDLYWTYYQTLNPTTTSVRVIWIVILAILPMLVVVVVLVCICVVSSKREEVKRSWNFFRAPSTHVYWIINKIWRFHVERWIVLKSLFFFFFFPWQVFFFFGNPNVVNKQTNNLAYIDRWAIV